MLAIKLKRTGKKHQPSYRVVVQEKREKLGGRYAEDVGWFDPLQNKQQINAERVKHWISVGAQPTNTVHNMFVALGIISGKKRPVHRIKKVEQATAPASTAEKVAAPAAEAVPETPTAAQ